MNAGPAGSAASRSRARLGLGAAAAEREVYKAALGNRAASRRGRPGPSRRPAGARHCLAAGAREGAAGSGARRGSARRVLSGVPGAPPAPRSPRTRESPARPLPAPSGTRRSAAAARPLLEDAVASPRSRPLSRDPDSWEAERSTRCTTPTPWKQSSARCMPPHPGAAHLSGPQLLGSVALHPAHAHPQDACCPQIPTLHPMHGPPSAPAYATPRASLRRWQGAGVLPHCVSVGESLRLSELPPRRLLVLLKAAVSQCQREMDAPSSVPRTRMPS